MRVPLLIDTYGWAHEGIARGLARAAKVEGIDFKILVQSDHPKVDWKQYRIAFCLDIFQARWLLAQSRLPFVAVIHLHPQAFYQFGNFDYYSKLARRALALGAINQELVDVWSAHGLDVRRVVVGINTVQFSKKPFMNRKRLVVGWVGNPAKRLKRFELIKRAVQGLPYAELKTATWHNRIPWRDMPQFYREIDVISCVSAYEGLPTPILEASSCARSCVSTPVGIVPELVPDSSYGLILNQNPSPSEIREAIDIFHDPAYRRRAGTLIAERCRSLYDWRKVVSTWTKLLEEGVKRL